MLYTGKGDAGTTKTFEKTKDRISKASDLPEALGTLDELNSYIGLARAQSKRLGDPVIPVGKKKYTLSAVLREIQENLFIVQAQVAGAPKKIGRAKVAKVELIVNTVETLIPPITSFSVSGGTELSAVLDVARTLSRRAERRVVGVNEKGLRKITKHTLAYLNRLSSLLFALARYANTAAGVAEENPRYR